MQHRRRYAALIAVISVTASCGISRYAANSEFPQIDADMKYNGILEECMYDSSTEGPVQRRMFVYLPKDYYETDEKYPTLYLLHGARGNELSWIVKGNILSHIDSLVSDGKMKKSIVVFPNMNQYNDDKDFGKSRLKGAMESLFETDGKVESAFVKDVVTTVDSVYRTIPDKEHRAIAGLSIGAMQSMHISANSPDTFGYIGLFSSMIHPVLRKSDSSVFYKKFRSKLKSQFSPPPRLYAIMIGKRDFYYTRMKSFTRYLRRSGYPYEIFITKGGHQWNNWKIFADIFMQKLF